MTLQAQPRVIPTLSPWIVPPAGTIEPSITVDFRTSTLSGFTLPIGHDEGAELSAHDRLAEELR